MLSPRFAEGRALAEAGTNTSTIPTISFPEDNPEAMVWICCALHLKTDAINSGLTLSLLKAIAVLCDKYDLSRALYAWSHLWVGRYTASAGAHNDAREIVWISCALGQDEDFWRSSRQLIISLSKIEMLGMTGQLGNGILPDRLLGMSALR